MFNAFLLLVLGILQRTEGSITSNEGAFCYLPCKVVACEFYAGGQLNTVQVEFEIGGETYRRWVQHNHVYVQDSGGYELQDIPGGGCLAQIAHDAESMARLRTMAWHSAHPHSVLLCGSHPSEDNDDVWTGADFATLDEARVCFDNPEPHFYKGAVNSSVAYIVLDSPDLPEPECRPNPGFKPGDDNDDWRREQAMQAGMAYGCAAYNAAMGYGDSDACPYCGGPADCDDPSCEEQREFAAGRAGYRGDEVTR